MTSFDEIVGELDDVRPEPDREVDWGKVDALLAALWATGRAKDALRALFGRFERFPTEDSFGVLWGPLHGIEATPGYEGDLLASVARCPSQWTVMMVNRLINGGVTHYAGTSLLEVLRDVANNSDAAEQVREDARGFLEYQASRSAG